jgi:hypothetical protein
LLDDEFPELRAASERIMGEVWEDEEAGFWESYIKDKSA